MCLTLLRRIIEQSHMYSLKEAVPSKQLFTCKCKQHYGIGASGFDVRNLCLVVVEPPWGLLVPAIDVNNLA